MVFKFIYDVVLFGFFLVSLPFWIWRYGVQRGKWAFLGGKLGWGSACAPPAKTGRRIWIHAVSLGETKAAFPLVEKIQKEEPGAEIIFSSTTETGLNEAKRQFPRIAAHLLLPMDLSFVIQPFVKKWEADLLLLVEGDLWYNFLSCFPNVFLINGKISERSTKRYSYFPFYTRQLFSKLSFAFLQSSEYASRFVSLGMDPQKIEVTGNLKLDQTIVPIVKEEWQKKFYIHPEDWVLTLGSTHAPEEKEILLLLQPLFAKIPSLKILLVPRHPERFKEVAEELEKEGISFYRVSEQEAFQERRGVTLVDQMGVLTNCYLVSEIAIVGGSFFPRVGGHNIMEPILCGIPVLFGPYMDNQKELTTLVLQKQVGKQVSLGELPSLILDWFQHPQGEEKKRCIEVAGEVKGVVNRIWNKIALYLNR